MDGMYNMRSPAVKRLMKEAQELREPTELYAVQPLEDNLFEWHFTIRGPADSEFDGGLYHGRIILPPEYPMKPPSIMLLTPNGRFETNKKICLSISGHHPESWQPSWSIRTALLAIIGFMPTHGAGALGSLDYTPEERKILAKRSKDFKCTNCGKIDSILKPVTEESKKTTQEAKQLASQIDFKDEKERLAAMKSFGNEEKQENNLAKSNQEETTPVEPASQPQTVPQLPPPTFGGQTPFRLQFMPPFPPYPVPSNGSTTGALSQVPRFPLPYGPMVPPFPMMTPGNFALPPNMQQGVPLPPWNAATMRMGTPTASNVGSSQDDRTQEVTSSEILSQSVPDRPTLAPVQSNTASVTSSSGTNSTSSPVSPSSSASTTTPASATTTASTEARSDISAAVNDSTSTSASAGTNPNGQGVTAGLRHRHTQPRATTDAGVGGSAQLPRRSERTESTTFYVFAVVIVVLIMMLLMRRLYVMGYHKLFI